VKLRSHGTTRCSARRSLRATALVAAALAVGVLLVVGSAGATVGVTSYTGTTLYLNNTASSTIGSSGRQLVTSAPSPGVTATTRSATTSPAYSVPPVPPCDGTAPAGACGYQEFAPGISFSTSSPTISPIVPSPAPNGRGWIVDAAGGVDFPTGPWTVSVSTRLVGGSCAGWTPPCTARLVVGLWKVTGASFATATPLIDPAGAGENPTNLVTVASVSQTITTTVTVPAFSLGWGDHVYVQIWRLANSVLNGANANRYASVTYNDGIAAVTHPTPVPSVTLSPASGRRTNAIPQLSGSGPGTGTAGVDLQLCSDSACGTVPVVQSTSGTGTTATWTPAGPLSDGVYYWRANARDSVSNTSGWTATRSFTLDTTAPNVPSLSAPADGVRTRFSDLSASFNDVDSGDTGTVGFRVCTTSSCSSVVTSGSSSSVGNGATPTWTINPSIPDGTYYWEAQAIDTAGNVSAWSSARSFTLDTTPPDTAIGTPRPASPTKLTSASFPFTATETGSIFECRFDSTNPAAFTPCSTPQAYPGPLVDGSHTFEVRATDSTGNVDPSPASYTWTVDTTAPDTSIPGKPASLSNTAAPSFDLASTEAGSTFECSRDSAALTACSTPKSYSGLSDGSHTFQVRSTDPAGNTDASPASYTWTIDTVPPETTLASPLPANATRATSADFNFSSEAGATLACSFDGAAFAPCTSPRSFVGLADGTHTFQVRATDAAGNVDPTPASATWRVDTAAPVTTIGDHPGPRSNEHPPAFTFTANEAVTGFECHLDNAAFASCKSPYKPSSVADGMHTVHVRSTDLVGNVGDEAAYTWTVDTTPPSTPALAEPADALWTPASPTFKATYLNPDAGDVGLVRFRICTSAAGAGAMCSDRVAEGLSLMSALNGGTVTWAPDTPLGDGTYQWQASAQDDATNRSGWTATRRIVVDTAAPTLTVAAPADAARATKAPRLTATFADATPGDSGAVEFQVCSDDTCGSVLASGSVAVAAFGTSAGWTPPAALAPAAYAWRVRATDVVHNSAAWSAVRRFVVDRTAPAVPELAAPDEGVKTRVATLSAGFLDPDLQDAGVVLFRICVDPGCRIVVSSGTSGQVAGGTSGTWTAPKLRDGSYFWQAAARDLAGNTSAWSAGRKLTLHRKPSGPPRRFTGSIVDGRFVFRWAPPAGTGAVEGYTLVVDGDAMKKVDGDVLTVAADVDPSGPHSFAVQAVDEAGNVSARTRTLVAVPRVLGLTAREASSILRSRGLVAEVATKPKVRSAVVVAQRPIARAVIERGSTVTVVARERPR